MFVYFTDYENCKTHKFTQELTFIFLIIFYFIFCN